MKSIDRTAFDEIDFKRYNIFQLIKMKISFIIYFQKFRKAFKK